MDNPREAYEPLRKQAPVYYSEETQAWFLSRYRDITAYLKDARLRPSWEGVPLAGVPVERHNEFLLLKTTAGKFFVNWHLSRHKDLRKRLNPDFSPHTRRFSEQLFQKIEIRSREILKSCLGRGRMEVLTDYANPLSFAVLYDLMGLPLEDQEPLSKMVESINRTFSMSSPEQAHESQENLIAFQACLRQVVQAKKKNLDGDVVSTLIKAEQEGILTEEEVLSQVSLLFLAGNQAVASQIAAHTYLLVENPEVCRELRANPALIPQASEEFMRFVSHVTILPRFAVDDLEVLGRKIRKGEMVLMGLGSANFDPEVFGDPETLNIHRSPNPHLGFGYGSHICPGMWLARYQLQISLRLMLEMLPNLRFQGTPPEWEPLSNGFLRGLPHLHLSFDPA